MHTGTFPPNLSSLSRIMARLSTLGAVLCPIVVAYVFADPGHSRWMMFDVDHLGNSLNAAIPLQYRLLALACALVPTGFTVWALWSLRNLFLCYARGEVFSRGALIFLRNVAIALFASVMAGFVMRGPMTLALTWMLGHGHRRLSFELGTDDLVTLFVAGSVLVIARVMVAANRIAEDHAGIV